MTPSDIQSPKPTERDPRVDPRPGDIVTVPGNLPFHVLESSPGSICGRFGPGMRGSLCALPYWRKWAATAEVVRRGENA